MQHSPVDPEDHLVLQVTFDGTATATICSVATMLHPSTGVCYPWYTGQLRPTSSPAPSSSLMSAVYPYIHRAAAVIVWTVVDCSHPPNVVRNALLATFKLKKWLKSTASAACVSMNVSKCAEASAALSLANRRELEAQVKALAEEKAAADAATAQVTQKLLRVQAQCDQLQRTLSATQDELHKRNAKLAAMAADTSRRLVEQDIVQAAMIE
ncbi:hypothetical protein B5M09_002730 [Aphanomyces astaci]|nr:hypothetical protein B5M09_002730 [Aphanomyces astaci]